MNLGDLRDVYARMINSGCGKVVDEIHRVLFKPSEYSKIPPWYVCLLRDCITMHGLRELIGRGQSFRLIQSEDEEPNETIDNLGYLGTETLERIAVAFEAYAEAEGEDTIQVPNKMGWWLRKEVASLVPNVTCWFMCASLQQMTCGGKGGWVSPMSLCGPGIIWTKMTEE